MESNKKLPHEQGKTGTSNPGISNPSTSPTSSSTTTGSTPGGTSATGHTSPTGHSSPSGQTNYTSGTAPQRAREHDEDRSNQSPIGQTKQVVTEAYDKTSEVLTNTYDQAMTYGRENPGKLTLIAFGAGIGIGLLLASNFSSGRSNANRYAEPVVNALSNVALEFFRSR